jgi:hypothetical protein
MTPPLTIAPGVTAVGVNVSDPDDPEDVTACLLLTLEGGMVGLDMPAPPSLSLTIDPDGATVWRAQWAWPATPDLPAVTEPADLTTVPLPRLQDIARWALEGAKRLELYTSDWFCAQIILDPSARPDGARYRVHMYRWGEPAADHTYEAADLDGLTVALARAVAEVEDRGGKYGAVVWRQPQAPDGGWMKRHTGTWQVMATVGMKDIPKETP